MMSSAIQFVGKDHVLQLFGVRLVGVTPENGKKLLISVIFVLLLIVGNWLLHAFAAALFGRRTGRAHFWAKQVIRLTIAVFLITGTLSIWFNDPGRLGEAAAFVTAGLAIASQKVITAASAYLIILRGKTFHVGDRIVMGGVRGDVIAVGFIQTTIMEMGEAPPEQPDAPSTWVAGRQYTGRIVTVSNDKIFDQPVYNFTRDFPYIWEEIHLPIPYNGDWRQAEQIILHAAQQHTTKIADLSEDALEELERRYLLKREDLGPRVYLRLTDNWMELALRFITEDHGIRQVKDALSRQILRDFDRAKISIASGTYDVVGLPEVKVRLVDDH
jgi:small-conductance mechanosensitive channel